MLLSSWPTRFLITRAARAYGFLDPIRLMSRLRGFARPSEVAEPVELLRAGMLFHARGLVNTKAIQNNLDWIWPYWVEKQFNPADESFIPRAFSFSHINLTHRNWTAVGQPDVPYYPIVDPRGLVTPSFDSWSLDFWLWPADGSLLLPSKVAACEQTLELAPTLRVVTHVARDGAMLASTVDLDMNADEPICRIQLVVTGAPAGWLVVALRPYNPEGISFVERIAIATDRPGWLVNGRHEVGFGRDPARQVLSVYDEGDVMHRLEEEEGRAQVACSVGLATAAALFPLSELGTQPLEVRVPIFDELKPTQHPRVARSASWEDALAPLSRLTVGDARIQGLYDQAVANVVLHSPHEVYPGPYTYKRFWFRDAAFILHALLVLGDSARTQRAMELFPGRQRHDGYFLSQEGEWDSNGAVLWLYDRFARLTGQSLPGPWLQAVARGARWIMRKRRTQQRHPAEAGLLPAGFSAEHLGPNDHYYWDNFWGVAGLRGAARLLRPTDAALAAECAQDADAFFADIERSVPHGPRRRFPDAIPAAPRRRMDSGAIGSIVADYPLQLFPPGDRRILATVDYLRKHSVYDGGFFQNMIHSGINAYLTLHIAQVLLRAGDSPGAWALIDRVAALASATGQWPEAIHPRTGGGCMGDGQHIWAAAEWALMIRQCFVREEEENLVIACGVKPAWWRPEAAAFGPTLTPWGRVSVRVAPADGAAARVTVESVWRGEPPRLDVRLPGHTPVTIPHPGPREDILIPAIP